MSSSALPVHPARETIARVHELLDELGEIGLWSLSDADLEGQQVEVERAVNRLTGAGLGITREVEVRGIPTAAGSRSTGTWLRDRLHIDTGEGKRRAKLANALGEQCPATGQALSAGQINAEHAGVIAATMGRAGRKLGRAELERDEQRMLDLARQVEPEQVRTLGKRLEYLLDPDGPEPKEQAARRRRSLHVKDLGEGWQRVTARLPDIDAARFKAALDPLAKPRPSADGVRDERTPTQRRYDAFMTVVGFWLDHNSEPRAHGNRPQLIITGGLDLLLDLAGAKPGFTGSGELVSAAMLRRLLCDAEVTRVLTGPESMPLDVGRKYRVATDAQYAALLVRDRGCVGPNCDAPASWTQVHHLTDWVLDGQTDLANLCLLCRYCHDLVHHEGWQARMGARGHVEFIPPPGVDPRRTPRVNTYWRDPDLFDPP